MPTYELRCATCGHRFDVFVMRLLRPEDKVCPVCGSHDVATGLGGGIVSVSSGGSSCGGSSGFG